MAPRGPLTTVRDAVHRAASRTRRTTEGDARAEELVALREAGGELGRGGDPARRATRRAEAYLAARRRRLRRQLERAEH